MNRYCLFYLLLLLSFQSLPAQDTATDDRTGVYRVKTDPSIEFRVSRKADQHLLQILGQGRTLLTPLSGGRYALKGVRPAAYLEFLQNDSGRTDRCRVVQDEPPYTWKKVGDSGAGRAASGAAGGTGAASAAAGAGVASGAAGDPLAAFTGSYQLTLNPYRVFHIREEGGRLFARIGGLAETPMEPLGRNRFQIDREGKKYQLDFKLSGGRVVSMVTRNSYPLVLAKVSSSLPRISNRKNGFTRGDSLQGMLTPLRSCYDVLFYHLDLALLPETRSIRGSNTIRWRAVESFRRLQVDLYDNLTIDTILYQGNSLSYTRDGNAVYIDLPAETPKGSIGELRIAYSGTPLQPDIDAQKGGIFWLTNRDRAIWIETVTQGIGASVFWPCKDHLSDRPDSMRITVTVPPGLSEISNGRLLERTELTNGSTRFDWYVDYPIVTYNVVINIGDYTHFTDTYTRDNGDTLALHFYCMPYNTDSARKLFADAKRMLSLYERDFGPYPFPRDGFTLLESIYPMDHQGAVSIGSMRAPFNSNRYDGSLRSLMWHESAHEWWGNSVGCSDYADMWIHEGFATFAEYLNAETLEGPAAARKAEFYGHPDNKEPIIGVYNVNHFHMGDMYLKGALLLQTLRNVIGNDSLWFGIFRGIQQRYRYTPVRTEDVERVFNTATGKDYTYFFDQYLRHAAIPVLALAFQTDGDRLRVSYKWVADVPGFHMPVKVTLEKGRFGFIEPTTTAQTLELKGMTVADFAVDTDDFYIAVKKE
jgi:hypothetical protein